MMPEFNYYTESEAITSPFNSTSIDFSQSEAELIAQLGTGIAAVSVVGSLFIIVSYMKFPKLRSFAFELILMVAISDFLRACAYILSPLIDPYFCRTQAAIMRFSETASILWVGSIAFTVHRTLLKDNSVSLGRRIKVKYHIFCWGISCVFTLLPFTTGDYESSDVVFCWVTNQTISGVLWAVACYYVPVWLVLCYLIYVYSKVWWMLKLRPLVKAGAIDSKKPKYRLITQKRMAMYPASFFLAIAFTTLNRVYQLILKKQNFYLVLFHVVASNLQGLLNSLVYGFTTAVRIEWIAYYCPRRRVVDCYVSFNEDWRGTSHTELEMSHNSSGDLSKYVLEFKAAGRILYYPPTQSSGMDSK